MTIGTILTVILISVTNLTITEPVDGETYDGDWLPLRAIVENENEIPDSVHYSLNGQTAALIPRLNTDWYTYMQNDQRNGYSESPAPHDATILWTAPVTGMGHEFVSPVVVNGWVYQASEEQEILFCLDAATGTEIWRFEDIGDDIDDAVHVEDGRVYLASDSIWCLDALTGAKIWSFGESEPHFFGGPPVLYSDQIFFCGLYVYSLDCLSGEEIWRTDTLHTASSLTAWNDMLFVPTTYGKFYALNTETGETEWVTDGFGTFWDSSPAIVDGEIYIGSWNGSLYRIDALTGSVINEFTYGSLRPIESTPAILDDLVYFGLDYYFYCVDRFSGLLQWELEIGNDFLHASPGVADGLVFWGDHDGDAPKDSVVHIHAVDIETGTEVWNYEITNAWKGVLSSPAITDGVMYIGAGDGNLYAFGTGLKYTYREDYFYAEVGSNELIVTSFDEGSAVAADTINFTVTQTGITLEPSSRLALCASPNPFYSEATISFELSKPGWTLVTVCDLSGRIVRTLENSELGTGQHSIIWDGRRKNCEPVPVGLYLLRIQSGGISETIGLCLLR
ncbi:MAG: PQQ-binding-like beta-propeller repeat protein [Candidatus Aegiribacteria sp.]|nr:PQQ-binding-like beta-propeller repeat protein [Candidatus Aegiribacteria sp.]